MKYTNLIFILMSVDLLQCFYLSWGFIIKNLMWKSRFGIETHYSLAYIPCTLEKLSKYFHKCSVQGYFTEKKGALRILTQILSFRLSIPLKDQATSRLF